MHLVSTTLGNKVNPWWLLRDEKSDGIKISVVGSYSDRGTCLKHVFRFKEFMQCSQLFCKNLSGLWRKRSSDRLASSLHSFATFYNYNRRTRYVPRTPCKNARYHWETFDTPRWTELLNDFCGHDDFCQRIVNSTVYSQRIRGICECRDECRKSLQLRNVWCNKFSLTLM